MLRINKWSDFYQTLVIDPGYGTPVRKPTEAQLDEFEKAARFKLPKSYRDFILVFGPGEFSSSLQIAAPGYSKALKPTFDLATANEMFGYSSEEAQSFPPQVRERLSRLYYFGLENGRNWLGWDTFDVRDSANHEYGIYKVGITEFSFVAGSFRELVETTCDRLFATDTEWDEEELGPRRTFRPATFAPQSE